MVSFPLLLLVSPTLPRSIIPSLPFFSMVLPSPLEEFLSDIDLNAAASAFYANANSLSRRTVTSSLSTTHSKPPNILAQAHPFSLLLGVPTSSPAIVSFVGLLLMALISFPPRELFSPAVHFLPLSSHAPILRSQHLFQLWGRSSPFYPIL